MSRHDPFTGLSESQLKFNLGGEVDMWGEGVDDTNFESFVFPKASAAAERMWSAETHPPNVAERLAAHRCNAVGAGVRVAPIGPGPPCGVIQKTDDDEQSRTAPSTRDV